MESNENMKIIVLYLVLHFISEAKCEEKPTKSKNPLPYFRRQVEEITDDLSLQNNGTGDDTHSNLVSFLIKNAKEIYTELQEDNNEISSTETDSTVVASSSSTEFDKITIYYMKTDDKVNDTVVVTIENSIDLDSVPIEFETVTDDVLSSTKKFDEFDSGSFEKRKEEKLLSSFKNATLVSFSDQELINIDRSTKAYGLLKKEELRDLSKKLILFETDHLEQDQEALSTLNTTLLNIGYNDKLRSCIYCNNVGLENCNDPKNRLIPSVVCDHDDDLCYSLHTPFGVIDRGCFDINHNLTTYVCSCNLCNYISISEMPYIFAKKQDWIDNIIELSRTRNFRQSVMKEMSCLKCEVNSSIKNNDVLAVSNCLAGSIGTLPTEYCDYNEVCAVKAIRKQGYIWRGCVKFPLFNYWWTLCDSDLCNYDVVVSIYDSE